MSEYNYDDLNEIQQQYLARVGQGNAGEFMHQGSIDSLVHKGLIVWVAKYFGAVDDENDGYELTDLGRAVLAQADSAKPEGGARDWQATYYTFNYMPYPIRITQGDNEHPTNYAIVRVYDKQNNKTDDFVESKAIVELESELATAREQVARLTERGSLIDWAIEAATVWDNFLNTTDSDAPPSEALCLTLNVIRSKVADYQRKQAAVLAGDEGGA